MSLTLVTGPANAAKAGFVLSRLREAAAAGRGPVLVVPTATDIAYYRRELGRDPDTVVGPRVVLFDGLVREAARATGVTARPLATVQRDAVVAALARDRAWGPLARSAGTAGFPAAAGRFLAELSATGEEPPRLARALRDWGAAVGRAPYADDLAGLLLDYRAHLRRLGRPDAELHAVAVADALRRQPTAWETVPIFLYGFDDLTRVQRDVVEALALEPVGAEVVLSLPAETGRVASAARLGLVNELAAVAERTVELPPDDAHYAPQARAQLHAVERGLLEENAPRAPRGDAVRLLEGGGERAELELVAAEILALLAAEVPASEIAVAVRGGDGGERLVVDVLRDAGVPVTCRTWGLVGQSAVGRALVALLSCGLHPDGPAEQLVAWLRSPGTVEQPGLVDDLEAAVLRGRVVTVADARAHWEEARDGRWPLTELDRVRGAAQAGSRALLSLLDEQAARRFARQHRPVDALGSPRGAESARLARTDGPAYAQGPLLDEDGRDEARALRAVRDWIAGLLELAELDPELLPAPADLADQLAAVPAPVGAEPAPNAVAVVDPLALRARRVRALFLVRMQEGVFPRLTRPQPFLDDEDRARLAETTGLRLPREADALAEERHLFASAVSRPQALLAVSWHAADDTSGAPRNRSPFVDDLADVLDPAIEVRTRPLGAVTWPSVPRPADDDGASSGAGPTAPPAADPVPTTGPLAARARVAAGPTHRPAPPAPLTDPAVLQELAAHQTWSATALESLLDCPVKWFVERWLRGDDLSPTPEAMARGTLSHRVLQDVFALLGEPLAAPSLDRARALLAEAIDRHQGAFPISADGVRSRAAVRRLTADLERFLAHAAPPEPGFAPTLFELGFGEQRQGEEEEEPRAAVELRPGLTLVGRIDRVDVSADGQTAVIVDYKGSANGVPSHAAWLAERRVQAALYLTAVRTLLDHDVAGALYQPLYGYSLNARGAVRAGVAPGFPVHGADALPAEDFEALLVEVLDLVEDAVVRVRTGALVPTPLTCAFGGGGCAHPGLCRIEGVKDRG